VVATTVKGPIIAIVGPTASGKTDLALNLAEKFGGEIICADSRTIYRGMDIGTAKPTKQQQSRVKHHLLDLIDPGETLSAAAFKTLAEAAIEDIWSRGKVAFLVGGSGLYIDAVLFDYQFPAEADPARRAELDGMTADELVELLAAQDPEALERVDLANRRRVIRAIETAGEGRSRASDMPGHAMALGLSLDKEVAQDRITRRVQKMLEEGFLQEVKAIGSAYGWESPAMSVIGYRAMKDVVLGTKSIGDGATECVQSHMALYKKQRTWFKRNSAIQWLKEPAEAEALVREFLAGRYN
jgi:tRNA dimethylallyltransferase